MKGNKFSFFVAPITNNLPSNIISLKECYNLIKSRYQKETNYLRSLSQADYKKEKGRILDYVTFAGRFGKRKTASLTELSGYMCLDFDHLNNLAAKKRKLIDDPFLIVQLVFVSPSGDGLKVIVDNPYNSGEYSTDYKKVERYIWRRYGLQIDKTSDVVRACFLCNDPDVWIRQKTSQVFVELQERFPRTRHLRYYQELDHTGYYQSLFKLFDN